MANIKTKLRFGLVSLLCTLTVILLAASVPQVAYAATATHSGPHHSMRAPKLSPKYPDLLVWKWHHPDPYRWYIYISLDHGKTFFHIDDYWMYGNARQFAPDGEEPAYIVGVDRSGKEITRHSRIVNPGDARI